jgi:hypothetical protein
VSVYPFNEYEYLISHLLARDVLSLDQYLELRDNYIARNMYLYIFEISAPRGFGEACCDVFVWIAVWRDVIKYWVLSSREVEGSQYYSKGQHRGNVGEGQLHVKPENIRAFDTLRVQPNTLADAIREAYKRQVANLQETDRERS